MCPIKTENLTLNVCRDEGRLWRKLAFEIDARSRGELQKKLLMIGLERLNPAAAKRLKAIRTH
jgi:hypothetical protein